MFVYCNINDSPRIVGEAVCRANSIKGSERSWIITDEGDFCSIHTNSKDQCVAVIYYVSDSVVGIEIDDECASKIIEPLLELYGFEKVKWLAAK